MRPILDMDTVQIEITNACHLSCSNCTRLTPHIKKPFMMEEEFFRKAVDSMEEYPKMTGIMGGEPLLHPQFKEFCKYAKSKLPKEQLGLWTSLPPGKEHYAELICDTFGHIFPNDHTIEVYHAPILVGAEEVLDDEQLLLYKVDHCWVQNSWSASINPKGAFFCEIAAALSMLFEDEEEEQENKAWPVVQGWWMRTPLQYVEQVDRWCRRCGCALSLGRRLSSEGIDDISPKNLERLRFISRRVKEEKYRIHDCKEVEKPEEMFQYKNQDYRDKICARYGMFLMQNEKGFLTPHMSIGNKKYTDKKPLFLQYQEQYLKLKSL